MEARDGVRTGDESRIGGVIKVVGVGGGGGNAIDTMIARGLQGVEFVVINSDAQTLAANLAETKVQIGRRLTRGLGAGGKPEIGRQAAEEDIDDIRNALQGADMVFLAVSLGGGTGTGAAPVVARVAKELGALTVAVVTKPFAFEATQRLLQAEAGIAELRECVDSLLVIPNERLNEVVDNHGGFLSALRMADDILYQAVKAMADLITVHGVINLDFADVRTVMANRGLALMGSGVASGEDRAVRAAQAAITNPLLEGVAIQGARGVLINVTGGVNMTFREVHAAATLIRKQVHEDALIIFGAVLDEGMDEEIRITVVATGFEPGFASVSPGGHSCPEAAAPAPAAESPAPQQEDLILEPPRTSKPIEVHPSPRRRVFVGTIEDAEDGPRLHRAHGTATSTAAPHASAVDEEPYTLSDADTADQILIPAFLRRRQG